MTKKKVILVAAAALFAVSGLTALPSGNIKGGEKRTETERQRLPPHLVAGF